MTAKTELRNFIDHYGWEDTLQALEELKEERKEERNNQSS